MVGKNLNSESSVYLKLRIVKEVNEVYVCVLNFCGSTETKVTIIKTLMYSFGRV